MPTKLPQTTHDPQKEKQKETKRLATSIPYYDKEKEKEKDKEKEKKIDQ